MQLTKTIKNRQVLVEQLQRLTDRVSREILQEFLEEWHGEIGISLHRSQEGNLDWRFRYVELDHEIMMNVKSVPYVTTFFREAGTLHLACMAFISQAVAELNEMNKILFNAGNLPAEELIRRFN